MSAGLLRTISLVGDVAPDTVLVAAGGFDELLQPVHASIAVPKAMVMK
jgi:hypothetical protein